MSASLLLPPAENQVEAIKKELGEVSGRFDNNLKVFEKWVECQDYLPKTFDKGMLSVYLRGVKGDIEAAKRKLQMYMFSRKNVPEIFANRDINDAKIAKILDNFVVLPLPKLTPEGNRVTIFTNRSKEISEFDMEIIIKICYLCVDYRVRKEHLNAGDIYILDAKNITVAHTSKFFTNTFRKALILMQEGLPMRIRGIYVINVWPFMDKLISFCKMLLKEKLRQRYFCCKDMSILKDVIPGDCLPVEYGGTEEGVEELCKRWKDHFQQDIDWYRQMDNDKITGSLPKDLAVNSNLFSDSVDGSFRKLDID